jgi:hypothetical protein
VRYLHHQADDFRPVSRNALGWRRADRASFQYLLSSRQRARPARAVAARRRRSNVFWRRHAFVFIDGRFSVYGPLANVNMGSGA